MKVKKSAGRLAAGIAGALLVTVTTMAGSATPAMAEMGVGRYLLCSKGNFTSVLEFHGSTSGPGFSYAALPGKCVKGNVAKGAQTITVHGWGKDGKAFQINKAEVLAFPLNKDGTQAAGLKFFTDGTVKKHTWYFKR